MGRKRAHHRKGQLSARSAPEEVPVADPAQESAASASVPVAAPLTAPPPDPAELEARSNADVASAEPLHSGADAGGGGLAASTEGDALPADADSAASGTQTGETSTAEHPKVLLSREELFAQGVQFEEKNDFANALRCFMACLSTLQPTPNDAAFPRFVAGCLEKVSNTFYRAGMYDEAVRFAQAERSVYETLLLHAVAPEAGADLPEDELTSLLAIADELGTRQGTEPSPAAPHAGAARETPRGPAAAAAGARATPVPAVSDDGAAASASATDAVKSEAAPSATAAAAAAAAAAAGVVAGADDGAASAMVAAVAAAAEAVPAEADAPDAAEAAARVAASAMAAVQAVTQPDAAGPGGSEPAAVAEPASAPSGRRDEASLKRRIDACDRMARLLTLHQKTELARQYARRAIELRQSLSGADGLMEGLRLYGMTFADLGREDYKAALERYRASVARQLESSTKAALAADRTAELAAAAASAPVTGPEEAAEKGADGKPGDAPFIPIEAFNDDGPTGGGRRRTGRRALMNALFLALVLLALIVGLVMLVYGLGVLQERGLYVSNYDDTVFNGIRLNVRDPPRAVRPT